MKIFNKNFKHKFLDKVFHKKYYYVKDNDLNNRFKYLIFRNVIFDYLNVQEINLKTKYNENLNINYNYNNNIDDEDLNNRKYMNYIYVMRQLDNVQNKGLSYLDNNKYNDKNRIKNLKIIKLFNKKDENSISGIRKTIRLNILEEKINNIKSRKMSNKLLEPHYFFTARYNERSMPSQLKHWTSSMYSYINKDKIGNNFLDLYTTKLINLFFSIKYMKKKLVWNIKLIEGFKILPNNSLIKDINTIINHTSNRTGLIIRKAKVFTPIIYTWDWVKKQIKYSYRFGKIIKQRRAAFLTGFYPKKKTYVRKLNKIMLSKPIFKHTSFNLLIDIFVYNNKRYKFRMLKNISLRRSIYKYMYSMYVNTYEKVKETINRPRFFYINIIEPNRYSYYRWITYYYEMLLIKKRKSLFIYVCLLLLQLNYAKKNKLNLLKNKIFNNIENNKINGKKSCNNKSINKINQIEKINNDKENIEKINNSINLKNKNPEESSELNKSNLFVTSISFKRLKGKWIKSIELKRNKYNKYLLCWLRRKRVVYSKDKFLMDEITGKFDLEDNKKTKKNIKERKSKILSYKKYFQDLKHKGDSTINVNNIGVLNNIGIKDKYNTSSWEQEEEKKKLKKKERKIRKKKYSYNREREKENRELLYEKIMNSKDTLKRKINKIRNLQKKRTKKIMKALNFSTWDELNLYNESKKEFKNNKKEFLYKRNKQNLIDIENPKGFFNTLNIELKKNSYINNYSNNIEHTSKIYKNPISDCSSFPLSKGEASIAGTNIMSNNLVEFGLNIENYIKEKHSNVFPSKVGGNQNLTSITGIANKDKHYDNNINTLFTTFYINKNYAKESLLNYEKNSNKTLNYIFTKPNKKKINSILSIKPLYKYDNSRVLWDKIDYSILNLLYNYFNINITGMRIQSTEINSMFNDINKLKGFSNIWYIIYFLGVIKKEFFNINKEILISKEYQILPYYNNMFNKSYKLKNDTDKDNDTSNSWNFDKEKMNIKFWSGYNENRRNSNLDSKLGFNEKIFKPYYRYLIPYFIFKSYKNFVSRFEISKLGLNIDNSIFNKINGIIDNKFIVYNFLTVKILLDLLHYNYRSILRVKSKYYYINKLRLYKTKFKKLNINNWIASIRFIRKLRKTPLNYWLRYHRAASFYYNRIVENAELDTKRKIFVPFVLYFEDLLYNIYGKWVIIRLWPLKRYYLSSFILAGRVLSLILWRKKRHVKRVNFQKITSKLITGIRILQIKKAYDYYINNNMRWPADLINNMKEGKKNKQLNYTNIEYFKFIEDRQHTLNTYILPNENISSYLPMYKDNYLIAFKRNIDLIHNWKLKDKVLNYDINNLQFVYYWLRPLKNYILKLNRSFDISGIKFRIKGRAGIRRNNLRSTYKTKFYGSFLGPTHSTIKLLKAKTISTPRLRGYLKSNIDYAIKVSKSQNGAISFKVWMSSVISTDMHELLLHLVHIKLLYHQLVNKYYIVDSYLKLFKYNHLILPKSKIENKKKIIRKY